MNDNNLFQNSNLKKDFTRNPNIITGKPMQCAAKGLYNSRRGAVADDGVPVSLDVDETVDPGPIAKLSIL